MDIWTSNHVAMFYFVRGYEYPLFAKYCDIETLDYLSRSGTCSYCGHDVIFGIECPGCGARMSNGESLIIGKARIKLSGFLPDSSWMFNNPLKIEAHIRDCGPPYNYKNWIARIVMTCLQVEAQSVVGFGFNMNEVIEGKLSFVCDILVEEL